MTLQDYAEDKGFRFVGLEGHVGIEALQEVSVASNVGVECVAVIDLAAAFVSKLDSLVNHTAIDRMILDHVAILYYG